VDDREGLPVRWEEDPASSCIGCGTANERSLGLRFVHRAGGVECDYVAPRDLNGAPGVVHGGIQAVMLDEAMGHAILAHLGTTMWSVTVDLRLRYRRPVHTEQALVLRAAVEEVEDRTVHVRGEILDESGQVLTRGTGEFRLIEPR
jgi:uncharacterized protein (TIGR00369 family)